MPSLTKIQWFLTGFNFSELEKINKFGIRNGTFTGTDNTIYKGSKTLTTFIKKCRKEKSV
jgi:hypothetical protein